MSQQAIVKIERQTTRRNQDIRGGAIDGFACNHYHEQMLRHRFLAALSAVCVFSIATAAMAMEDPHDSLQEWCDGSWYIVDGADGYRNEWYDFEQTFTIPPGISDVTVKVYIFTREWPEYTRRGPQNLFNDALEAQAVVGSSWYAMSDSVTRWHGFLYAENAGLPGGAMLYDAWPFHFSDTTLPKTLKLSAQTFNKFDATRGSGVAFKIENGVDNNFVRSLYVLKPNLDASLFLQNFTYGVSPISDYASGEVVDPGEYLFLEIWLNQDISSINDMCPVFVSVNESNSPTGKRWIPITLNSTNAVLLSTRTARAAIPYSTLAALPLTPSISQVEDGVAEFCSSDNADSAGPLISRGGAWSSRWDSDKYDQRMRGQGWKSRGAGRDASIYELGSQYQSDPVYPDNRHTTEFLMAAGVRHAKVRCGQVTSNFFSIRDQADTLYLSVHGKHTTGRLLFNDLFVSELLRPDVVNTSNAWRGDLDEVIIAGCSVLDICDLNQNFGGAEHFRSPGLLWAATGPKLFLGYNATAPLDERSAPTIPGDPTSARVAEYIVKNWANRRFGGGFDAADSWRWANKITVDSQPPILQPNGNQQLWNGRHALSRPFNACAIDLRNPSNKRYGFFLASTNPVNGLNLRPVWTWVPIASINTSTCTYP